ncbi:hypothetical protein FA13DRAFT_1741444 [Coprinellus micaceus]|uniref:F-box domain-containing protein n=1 Tax=Coprinellus micaceus TaxID=71717 RepID=A0A4Y7SJ58_COPMI|nr:hypothetical protein FA13DRAFT_1741444 [Coprinellus micaceus]
MDSIVRPMRTLSSLPTFGLDDLGIPGDLWIEIAVKLDPLDVLILSETCRTLYSLLTEKSVWIRVLRIVVRSLGSFIPSYSLSSMSVRELQRAAAGPYRWRRIGERGVSHTDSLSPESVITKSLRKWEISVDEVKLVPGGRFAVTRTTEQSPETGEAFPRTITLWDLGLPGVARQAPMRRV